MDIKKYTGVVSGWQGGFEQSNPDFAYPNPNLTSLPMLDNMANIDLLQRQQAVKWPEFSWETEKGNSNPKRCYQMFAPDISRLGYTDTGRVYSIICPQQGISSPSLGTLNVEVTVTGQRGWVDETDREIAADMSVVGKIWFSPSAVQKPIVKLLWSHFEKSKQPFPSEKSKAIVVYTHKVGQAEQPIFPLLSGESTGFDIPEFAKHPQAWSVGNLGVEIGAPLKTGYPVVDAFNKLIMDVFNLGSGNMLQVGNVLTWNVWFTEPELVDTEEWRTHAQRWRESIDADHGSPDGPGTQARYFDGTPFKPDFDLIKELEKSKIGDFLGNLEGDIKEGISECLKEI
ncbi:hypothetical protein [Shewanella woodyi]|uniref:Uncharacterized protein n=1 Tax=Shewanella woodyi (strain ATCC 51908 / MS32) TaxID=392500 RepID=B1KFD9_SHEWM|nr:hypothetical protein [Shewanella woodyi]ACA88114.1 conserved hypothetical protein [Shewanella woodyi ATCC 51908]